jgi:hypothetical protein
MMFNTAYDLNTTDRKSSLTLENTLCGWSIFAGFIYGAAMAALAYFVMSFVFNCGDITSTVTGLLLGLIVAVVSIKKAID